MQLTVCFVSCLLFHNICTFLQYPMFITLNFTLATNCAPILNVKMTNWLMTVQPPFLSVTCLLFHDCLKPSRTLAANRDDSPPTANGGCATGSAGATGGARGRSLNMEMKFVCGQCWRDGVVSEPDRALKYCMAKARHRWASTLHLTWEFLWLTVLLYD